MDRKICIDIMSMKLALTKHWICKNWKQLLKYIVFLMIIYCISFFLVDKPTNEPMELNTQIRFGDFVEGGNIKSINEITQIEKIVGVQTAYIIFDENRTQIRYRIEVNPQVKDEIKKKGVMFSFNENNHLIFNIKNLSIYLLNEEGDYMKRLEKSNFDTELSPKEEGKNEQWLYRFYTLEQIKLDNGNNFWLILDFNDNVFHKDFLTLLRRRGDLMIYIRIIGDLKCAGNTIILLPQETKINYYYPEASLEPSDPYIKPMKRLIFDFKNGKDATFEMPLLLNYFDFPLLVALFAALSSIIFGLISLLKRHLSS